MKPIIPLHNGKNGMRDLNGLESSQAVSQSILSSVINTVNPLVKTTKDILSPTNLPYLVKSTSPKRIKV